MNFGSQFEYHKIPEWYTMYLDYQLFQEYAQHFETNDKDKNKKGKY